MVAAWAKYFQEGGLEHEGASAFARAMYEQMKMDGLNEDDLARAQVGHSFAIIGTTGPAAWWLIYHIFSDPVVLTDVVSVRSILSIFPLHLRPTGCTVSRTAGYFLQTLVNIPSKLRIC